MQGRLPKIFVLDTSVILYDFNAIQNFQEHDVAIPITVLEELDHFKKGDQGFVKTHRVSRATAAGTPKGWSRVTALQDVDAGKNGWFEDVIASSKESR